MKTVTFDETLWQVVPKDLGLEARSWPEDYIYENGSYFNSCCNCGRQFMGHKGRVSCKQCAVAPTPPVVEQEPVAEVRIFNNGFCDYTDVSWDRSLLKAGDKLYLHPAPSELEALRRDAERYRWARNCTNGNAMFCIISGGECGENMDFTVDAAMRESK